MSLPGESSISVKCTCGKKLKAPASSVGKRARCPACGSVVVLNPSPAVASAPAVVVAKVPRVPVTVGAGADDFNALYELAEQEDSATPLKESARCPQCRGEWAGNAVLCINCGYDTRTGKSASMAKTAKPVAAPAVGKNGKKKPVDLMAPTGSFVPGLILSALFALAASLVWIGVAWAIHLTIGYIAILIGGAAGLGMQIGQKGHSTAGGYAAAGMTLVAIILAKLAVLQLVLERQGLGRSIFDLDSGKLAFYMCSPIGLIIIAVGMGAAYRTANGSSSN